MAHEVDTGMFYVNSYGLSGGVESTLGGRKRSGIGTEKGEEGFLAYTVLKTVVLPGLLPVPTAAI